MRLRLLGAMRIALLQSLVAAEQALAVVEDGVVDVGIGVRVCEGGPLAEPDRFVEGVGVGFCGGAAGDEVVVV